MEALGSPDLVELLVLAGASRCARPRAEISKRFVLQAHSIRCDRLALLEPFLKENLRRVRNDLGRVPLLLRHLALDPKLGVVGQVRLVVREVPVLHDALLFFLAYNHVRRSVESEALKFKLLNPFLVRLICSGRLWVMSRLINFKSHLVEVAEQHLVLIRRPLGQSLRSERRLWT